MGKSGRRYGANRTVGFKSERLSQKEDKRKQYRNERIDEIRSHLEPKDQTRFCSVLWSHLQEALCRHRWRVSVARAMFGIRKLSACSLSIQHITTRLGRLRHLLGRAGDVAPGCGRRRTKSHATRTTALTAYLGKKSRPPLVTRSILGNATPPIAFCECARESGSCTSAESSFANGRTRAMRGVETP